MFQHQNAVGFTDKGFVPPRRGGFHFGERTPHPTNIKVEHGGVLRRMAVDAACMENLALFCDTLRELFAMPFAGLGELGGQNMLQYRDIEGDWVTVTSQLEFTHSAQHAGPLYRLQIIENPTVRDVSFTAPCPAAADTSDSDCATPEEAAPDRKAEAAIRRQLLQRKRELVAERKQEYCRMHASKRSALQALQTAVQAEKQQLKQLKKAQRKAHRKQEQEAECVMSCDEEDIEDASAKAPAPTPATPAEQEATVAVYPSPPTPEAEEQYADRVTALMEMGFGRAQAQAALNKHTGCFDKALVELLEG
eukprot:NODE_800_length_1186_cov_41.653447_g759_i0.p1 GENE.NODE_800_length_1186_cov_41.653447_g759_i0~~NODE_800_length_1186_cov_41.653447_g759_i0.p1  ORF type:complete len:307 (+),score=83.92 NODE_800_length_1186_cov_41.653447_g759_i0:99-1019(+)